MENQQKQHDSQIQEESEKINDEILWKQGLFYYKGNNRILDKNLASLYHSSFYQFKCGFNSYFIIAGGITDHYRENNQIVVYKRNQKDNIFKIQQHFTFWGAISPSIVHYEFLDKLCEDFVVFIFGGLSQNHPQQKMTVLSFKNETCQQFPVAIKGQFLLTSFAQCCVAYLDKSQNFEQPAISTRLVQKKAQTINNQGFYILQFGGVVYEQKNLVNIIFVQIQNQAWQCQILTNSENFKMVAKSGSKKLYSEAPFQKWKKYENVKTALGMFYINDPGKLIFQPVNQKVQDFTNHTKQFDFFTNLATKEAPYEKFTKAEEDTLYSAFIVNDQDYLVIRFNKESRNFETFSIEA